MATPIPANRARITTAECARIVVGAVVRGNPEREHTGITTDSRAAGPGSAFIALRGERFDGHDFVASSIAQGATLVVVEKGRAPAEAIAGDAAVVEVADTLDAWGAIAHAHLEKWRSRTPRRPVIAITGSTGKTTTKELLAALLASLGTVRATVGNLNNRIGVPAMVLSLEDSDAFAVLECGMSLPGEMAKLAAIVEPDVAAITNVGVAHAENVGGTREGVANEKAALFRGVRQGGVLVANRDDELVRAEAERLPNKCVYFGRGSEADVRLVIRKPKGFEGSEIILSSPEGPFFRFPFPLVGDGAAMDLVCAIAAAQAAIGRDLEPEEIIGAIENLPPMPGRAHVARRADGLVVVDDSYNANPQSMQNAVESLAEMARTEGRRAVCVLGEMKEIGDLGEAAHDELGDQLVKAGVALAIGCGGLVERTTARAAAGGVATMNAANAEEAAALAVGAVQPTDVVLVKGSRSIGTERVVKALLDAETSTSGKTRD